MTTNAEKYGIDKIKGLPFVDFPHIVLKFKDWESGDKFGKWMNQEADDESIGKTSNPDLIPLDPDSPEYKAGYRYRIRGH